MDIPKRFLHDRVILLLLAAAGVLLVIGISIVMLRFDVSKNPTTIVTYRPNFSGESYVSGKPLDIYSLGIFMAITAVGSVILSAHIYTVRRFVSIFVLASSVFLLLLATIVANSLISLQ